MVTLLPRAAFLARTAAVFLLLIDDHFFFSGQSRYVYLNPALIGILALAVWLGARSWKRPERFALPAILVGILAAAVKTHGIFFLAGLITVGLVALLRHRRLPRLDSRTCALLALAAGGAMGFFGLKWIAYGSPLAPFDFLMWKADHYWRDPTTLMALKSKTALASLRDSPWRALIFPGNLAMKAVAVLLLPALTLNFPRRMRQPRLAYATIFFVVTAVWDLLSRYLNVEESRYPRYVFGVAVLGLCCFALYLFRTVNKRVFRIPAGVRTQACHLASLLLCLRLVATIDTRYYNVPSGERPRWKNILSFAGSLGSASSLSPRSPHMAGLYMSFMYDEVARLEACVEKLPEAAALARGDGLVIFSPFSTWPMLLLSPGAVTGSLWEGGGYLRQAGSVAELKNFGIRYAIVPKDKNFPVETRSSSDQLSALRFQGTTLCDSPAMQLRRLD